MSQTTTREPKHTCTPKFLRREKCCPVADTFARTKSCHSRTYIYTRAGKMSSVLHIDEKTAGGREGFLTWLKDIFNKFVAEDKSHEADTSIVTIDRATTTLDHPEITVSKRPADSSVDVVNQKLTNFNTTQSMTKDGNIEKYNAENDEKRANAIQQSATYISWQSSEGGKTLERGADFDFTWFNPDEIHRSERNVMKFAARDDSDVAAHYRRYTNPRHCYRLLPRTKHPLLESCALNRNIGVSTRAIADFAPRNTKPPVREPNMPEKREKIDEKKNRKEKKKPVIRTDGEFADSSENQAEMVADDNPKSDSGTVYRYEWGVKLAEEPAVETSDNSAEKSQRYVTKQFWGVNLKQPVVEDAPSQASKGPESYAEEHQNTVSILKSSDTIANETRRNVFSSVNVSAKEPDAPSLKGTTAEYLSTPSYRTNLPSSSSDPVAPQQEKTNVDSSVALRKIMKTSSNKFNETITSNDEYNVPEEAALDIEITAWKNLAMKSKRILHKEVYLSPDNMENMDMVSIRPEAPQPQLDVQVVKPSEDLEEVDQSNSEYKTAKSMEMKHFGSPQKPEGYIPSKRLHTASTQIRYAHWHVNSIATLSNTSALDKTMQRKCSRPAFSTNSENSKEIIIKIVNQQNKEETDLKSWNKEEESNDSNANNSFNIKLSSESVLQDKETYFKDDDIHEIEHNDSHNKDATYIDFDTPSTDRDSDLIKLSNVKLSGEGSKSIEESNKNIIWDPNVEDAEKESIDDDDYVRLPGDYYPYSKENLKKWSPFIHKPATQETKFNSIFDERPSLRKANDMYANVTPDSHADAVMKTSGSGDGLEAKNTERSSSGFHVSSRSQRVVSDCLRGDAADVLGLQRWNEAFSRLDVRGEMNEVAARGDDDDVSSRAYHQ
ncbi:hypothetical protein ACFW04_004102 [Cataglyphis niger]